jgi:hypothetical protein
VHISFQDVEDRITRKKEAEGRWNPSHLDSIALATRLSLNKTEGYCYRTKISK